MQFACPEAVRDVLLRLDAMGYATYLVGGCIRDTLLGVAPKDWDLATAAPPEVVRRAFDRVIPVGLQHGTVIVLHAGLAVEVTTFRTRHGAEGTHCGGLAEAEAGLLGDLAARDFTVNAMAWHPQAGLVDPHGGRRHLRRRLVMAVGDAAARFRADPLRILRAVRLAAALDFAIAGSTKAAMTRFGPQLAMVSPERIQGELNRMLLSPRPGMALRLLQTTGLLPHALPEMAPAVGFDQRNPFHRFDVYEHTCQVVEALPAHLHVRLAALCHDMAKPHTFSIDDVGRGHFYGHAQLGAKMAEDLLRRLRYDNETVRRVPLLVREHMFPSDMGLVGMRRLIRRVGADEVTDLLELRRADMAGSGVNDHDTRHIDRIRAVLAEMQQAGLAAPAGLAVTGHDVMAALGVAPGPVVGAALRWLVDQVLDGHVPNEPEDLLSALVRMPGQPTGPA